MLLPDLIRLYTNFQPLREASKFMPLLSQRARKTSDYGLLFSSSATAGPGGQHNVIVPYILEMMNYTWTGRLCGHLLHCRSQIKRTNVRWLSAGSSGKSNVSDPRDTTTPGNHDTVTTWKPQRDVMLLDGLGIAYRQYHGLHRASLSNSAGKNTATAYGFTTFVLSILRQFKPAGIVVVFDTPSSTEYRQELIDTAVAKGRLQTVTSSTGRGSPSGSASDLYPSTHPTITSELSADTTDLHEKTVADTPRSPGAVARYKGTRAKMPDALREGICFHHFCTNKKKSIVLFLLTEQT